MIRIKTFLYSIRMSLGIEPVLVIYSGLQSIVSHGLLRDVITEKVCGGTNCTDEQFSTVNSYHYYHNLLEAIPSILPCLILGGWSDYHGRLSLVTVVLCGDFLKNCVILAEAATQWNVPYILLASSISGITGNRPLMMLACLARSCDTTDPRGRTVKLGCIVGLWWLGQGCGFVTVAYRTANIDYGTHCLITIIAITVVLCLDVALIVYTNICTQETVPDFGDYNGSGWRTIVIPMHINSTVNSILKQRVYNARACLLSLLGLIVMSDLVIYGEQAISYQYLSSKLHIGRFLYSVIYGGSVIIASIAVVIFILATRHYEIQDCTLGVAGAISCIVTSLLLAAVTKHVIWPAYVVLLPYVFNLLVPTVTLSLLSKVVHTSEIGSMLAGVATLQSIIPFVAEIIYVELYTFSHSSFSASVYLLSMLLSIISAVLFLLMKRSLNPCLGFFDTSERVPLINHSECHQGTVL